MLTDTDGTVKMSDYGYSVLLHSLLEKILPIDDIAIKFFWIAPENLRGSNSIDTRSDIWGLGCLAFELLTNKPPFWDETGGNLEELKRLHKKKRNPG